VDKIQTDRYRLSMHEGWVMGKSVTMQKSKVDIKGRFFSERVWCHAGWWMHACSISSAADAHPAIG
jgi:hypothetical protein